MKGKKKSETAKFLHNLGFSAISSINSKVKDVSLQVNFDSANNLFELIILGQDQGREFRIDFNSEFVDSIIMQKIV